MSAHPRSRGEHMKCPNITACKRGSSPLARGTRVELQELPCKRRLIPARAGNTLSVWVPYGSLPAHPRSRGEHSQCSWNARGFFGSSPLARGTRNHDAIAVIMERLIPARAGNTARWRTWSASQAAHPRSRGEHAPMSSPVKSKLGSSPLARGTHRLSPGIKLICRLIPARAGNTGHHSAAARRRKAHPRSRGEHSAPWKIGLSAYGSSPLARGTQLVAVPVLALARLIPARAGNTRHSVQGHSGRPAHPRSRGEHSGIKTGNSGMSGSSPLARGTHALEAVEALQGRLIPARAGNTFREARL